MTEGSPENNSIYLITESQLDRMLDYVEDDLNHSEGKYKDARALAADIRLGTISSLAGHDAAIAAQEKALDLKKEALKEQKEVPLGVTEKCYIDMHGKKGFDEYGIFEPVKVTVDYAVISVEAKKIQDQIEASKAAKKKQAVLK